MAENKNKVLVVPHRGIKGWKGGEVDVPVFPVVTLDDALEAVYTSDAHFMPYYVQKSNGLVPTKMPRLNKESLEVLGERGDRVLFSCVVLDIDDEAAHENNRDSSKPKMDARPDWRMEQDDLYGNLAPDLLGGMGRYDTRGGYRLIWKLSEALGPKEYVDFVGHLRSELRMGGIIADALKDWGRLYRLPFVTREGRKLRLDTEFGDLGPIRWKPSTETTAFDGIEETRTLATAPDKITKNRNNTLTRLAGGFRRRGFGYEVIVGLLDVINMRQCEPPLEAEEIELIARSVSRYDPEPPETPAPDGGGDGNGADGGDDGTGGINPGGPRFTLGDEVEVARVAAEEIENDEGLVYDRSKMWQYTANMGVWQELEGYMVDRVIHSYSGEMIMRGHDRNGDPRFAPMKVASRFCEGVQKVMSSQKNRPLFFDNATDGLVFRNKFIRVNADGVQTEDFSPEHRQTAYLPFEYKAGAKPNRFISMLRGCFRDDADCDQKISLIREWIGSALCNRATVYQRGMIFLGSGANGKSTVQEIVMAMFPAGTVTSIAPQDMENEYRRAKLSTSRLNTVAELPEADILQSEAVKAMIGGDLVSARYIREAVFEYKPRAAHLFSANSLPGVRDMTQGFWRRWVVVGFNRAFEESEMDRRLAGEIVATELSEIASWSVDGAAELAGRGFYEIPESSVALLKDWRHQADQVACFLEARCKNAEVGKWENAATLYNTYSQWAAQNGHRRMSRVNFGKRLKLLGVEKGRRADGVTWALEIMEATALVV